MPDYISEFRYVGDTSEEFIEVALPSGTDPTGYVVHIYQFDGTIVWSYSLGTSVSTSGGYDVYLINAASPGFDDGGADPTGRIYPDDALALVDGSGTVQQFISYDGNTVTATEGPANGLTSTSVGSAGAGQSLQSDDRGATYFTQSSLNPGTIPACYAPGTLIRTPTGEKRIEDIVAGDLVLTAGGSAQRVLWVWSEWHDLATVDDNRKPVLIRKGALGPDRPCRDMVVSGQHRLAVGGFGQLDSLFPKARFVAAKALTGLPGVRLQRGKRAITWHHLLCADHQLINANGAVSETLFLGATFLHSLTPEQTKALRRALNDPAGPAPWGQTALPCLSVKDARSAIGTYLTAQKTRRIRDRLLA